MRVTCRECAGAVDLDGLKPVEGGFGFDCPHCAAVNVLAPVAAEPSPEARTASPAAPPEPARASEAVPAEPPAAPEPDRAEPLPPGMTECPKCAHRQYDDDACHRCGLDFARYRAGQARGLLDPLAGHPLADTLRRRWAELSQRLDDEQGHRDFIGLCAEHKLLEYAGQCYRKAAAGRPEDPRITAYREKVIQAALVRVGRLEARAQRVVSNRLRGMLVVGVVAFIFLAFAVGLWLLSRYQTQWQAAG
ncbi:MAG: hypothetical protein KC613_14305 [Myxococcales bacterium]|nr:hypothetical protein [Myxococcales bacterium]